MTTDTKPSAQLSIRSFKDAPSADVRIKDPITGAPFGIVIQVAGPEHPERKRLSYERQRRMRMEMSRTGKLPVSDPREDELDTIDYLATCTLGWQAPEGSGMPDFSRAAAQQLYADPELQWLRRQVQTAVDEAEAFIVRSEAA